MKILMRLAVALLLVHSQPSMAECGDQLEGIKAGLDSIKRLDKALKSKDCLRSPTEDERVLYTWGHKEKFRNLEAWPYAQFQVYNKAQQYAYAGQMAKHSLFREITADPKLLGDYLFGLKSVYGMATVGQLYSYSNDPDYLIAIQNYWRKTGPSDSQNVRPLQVPMRGGQIDRRALKDSTTAAYEGLLALGLDQVNPGFIDDIAKPLDRLIRETEVALEKAVQAANDRDRRIAEGRLLGFRRAENSIASGHGKPSNISYGPAVYFSADAGASLGHYYDQDHAGRACTLNEQVRITDISGEKIQQILLKKGVFMTLNSDPSIKAQFPGGYNELSSPAIFRAVMETRLMKFGGVYADNGSIDYVRDCRPVRLSDFDDCDSIATLIGKGLFLGSKEQPGPLYNLLVSESDTGALENFLARIAGCAGSTRGKEQICRALQDDSFAISSFYSNHQARIDPAKDSCGK